MLVNGVLKQHFLLIDAYKSIDCFYDIVQYANGQVLIREIEHFPGIIASSYLVSLEYLCTFVLVKFHFLEVFQKTLNDSYFLTHAHADM